jgi:expansin
VRTRLSVVPLSLAACTCGGGGGPPGDALSPCEAVEVRTGEATYYDADGGGACSFDPTPGDLMVAAINAPEFAGSAACGVCVAVAGPRGAVTVRIVDLCPGCGEGHLDLSAEAFAQIADPAAGRVAITWRPVPCAVDGPVRYRWKEGTNPWWAAIQVRDHRHAIVSLDARPAGGAWRTLPREPYNYFVAADGLGDGAIDVRITDSEGESVEDAIALGDAVEVAGAAQLPGCEPPPR